MAFGKQTFSKINHLCCPNNQSNSVIWTKVPWNVENYSMNNSVKIKSIISNEAAEITDFYFLHYKFINI